MRRQTTGGSQVRVIDPATTLVAPGIKRFLYWETQVEPREVSVLADGTTTLNAAGGKSTALRRRNGTTTNAEGRTTVQSREHGERWFNKGGYKNKKT